MVNQPHQFFCHTKRSDSQPEVIIEFSEGLSAQTVRFYYRATEPSNSINELDGLTIAVSRCGVEYFEANVKKDVSVCLEKSSLSVEINEGVRFIKISRPKGGAIVFSQLVMMNGMRSEFVNNSSLISKLAHDFSLDISSDGNLVFNKKRSLFAKALSISKIDSQNIDALFIEGLGRFSNALLAIVKAVKVACKLGVSKIYIPENSSSELLINGRSSVIDVKGEKISLIKGFPFDESSVLSGKFFYAPSRLQSKKISTLDITQPIGEASAIEVADYNARYENDFAIHIRSGDIFEEGKRVHPGYGQPPLCYYTKILKEENVKSVKLVYEDERNPVINPLVKFLEESGIEFSIVSSSLKEDIESLLTANTVVAGYGTFIPGVISLSKNIKKLYQFQIKSFEFESDNIKYFLVKDKLGGYVESVMSNNWRNTKEQRNLMVTYQEENMDLIPIN